MEKKRYHEINQYRDPLFPVELYHVSETGMLPFGRGVRDFHWHDELQLTLAVRGSLTLQVNAEQYVLQEGEAAFINSGMLHAVIHLSPGGRYTSLNFPYQLLSFFPGSRMEKEDVLPYVTGSCVPALPLRPGTARQRAALEHLREINAIWAQEEKYRIAAKLAALWSVLYEELSGREGTTVPADLVGRQRMQTMLSFLYEHFSEDIMLADIAGAANISVGECCRMFRRQLGSTPHRFLTEYRIHKSIELLSGELSVSEIAGRCGYNQVSNYIARFKSILHCTPAQYRKRKKPAGPAAPFLKKTMKNQESG